MIMLLLFVVQCLLLVTAAPGQNISCGQDEERCNDTVHCIPISASYLEKAACQNSTTVTLDVTNLTCPTNLTCRVFVDSEVSINGTNYTEICLEEEDICDGVANCTDGEDEQNCACPDGCFRCQGSFYKCRPESLPEIPLMAKTIDISGYTMDVSILCNMTRKHLEVLHISNAKIESLTCLEDGNYFPALQELDASKNNIRIINKLNLPALKTIRLDYNPIKKLKYLSSIKMIIRYANLERMEWIINEGDAIAPLEFKPVVNYTEPNPMGAKIECNIIAIDFSYNSLPLLDTLGHCQKLTDLNLARNKIKELDFWSFNGMQIIQKVDLSFNWLESLGKSNFFGLTELIELNLSYNRLVRLDPESFFDLGKLKKLRLNNNKFQTLPWPVFSGLDVLEELYLQENKLKTLPVKIFRGITKLIRLDLRNNNLTSLAEGIFMSLGKLIYLDLRGNEIRAYETMFSGLGILEYLKVHSFTLCCSRPASVDIGDCEAPADIFSSCTNLINLGFLSVCIWFTAIMSVFGNMMALIFRIRDGSWIKEMRDIFISSLCLSDMCMGAYLVIIALTDVRYRGDYGYHHQVWTKSRLCDAAGVLVTASSEASTLFILAITLDRYTVFKYPFSKNVHKRSIAVASVVVVWIFAVAVAICPFFFPDFFGGSFYTRSSVCISLPLTPTTLQYSGWEYSVALFIVFNLFVYFIVVAGQIFIFKEIRKSGFQNDKKREREIAVAKNLSAVVISDTFCWIPIAIVGFFALNGIDVTNDVYAWIIVFVLPVNSAINPFLYTFLAMRRKRAKNQSKSSEERSRSMIKLHIEEIRPQGVPCCGLPKNHPRGCMYIITDPEISDDTEVDVIFSDNQGWTKKSDEVEILYEIIRCSVPPYKEEIEESRELKVQVFIKKTTQKTPPFTIKWIPNIPDGSQRAICDTENHI